MTCNDLQLKDIRAFFAVAELGIFIKFAAPLSIPPFSASKVLRRLEDWAGRFLLDRSTKFLSLIAKGMTFFLSTCQILDHQDKITAGLRSHGEIIHARLSILAPIILVVRKFLRALRTFSPCTLKSISRWNCSATKLIGGSTKQTFACACAR